MKERIIISLLDNAVKLSHEINAERLFRGVIPYLHKDPITIQILLSKLIGKFREKDIINKADKIIIIRAYVNKKNHQIYNDLDNYNNGIFFYEF